MTAFILDFKQPLFLTLTFSLQLYSKRDCFICSPYKTGESMSIKKSKGYKLSKRAKPSRTTNKKKSLSRASSISAANQHIGGKYCSAVMNY